MKKKIQTLFTGILTSFLPVKAFASGVGADLNPCTNSHLNCVADLPGYLYGIFIGTGLNGYAINTFAGIVFAMLVFYGFRLIAFSKTETSEIEGIKAYISCAVGTVVVYSAVIIEQAVIGEYGDVIQPQEVVTGSVVPVIGFIKALVAGILSINLFIQGVRFIVSLTDGNIDSARKNLIQSIVGTGIVFIATPVIEAIVPGTMSSAIPDEIVGVANFIVTIFGALAVLAFILAGVMLVISVEDSLRDKARNLMIASLVSIAIVVSSYSIIQILL